MNNVLDLLGKPILSLYECKIEGTISNFWLDKNFKKIKWLTIVNEEYSEERFLDISYIYASSEDAIVIKSSDCLANEEEIDFSLNHLSPINHKIFNTKGKLLGTVKNLEFDDKYNINNFCFEDEKFTAKNIANCGENIIIIQDKNSNIKIPNIKTFDIKNMPKTEQEVFAMPITISSQKEVTTPPVITTRNYDFLLNRKATKNIYTSNNEIIIKKNTKITEKHLESARKNAKLRELALNSK